jgi:cytochrome c-type biogenesis protein CcmH/NrfG
MRSDSIVFAIAGTCFGIILGWVIGTQQASKRASTAVQLQQSAPAPAAAAAPGAAGDAAAPGAPHQPPPLDEGKVQSLETIIKSDPKNAGAHIQLANTYFDAERYPDAIKWYEAALKLDPKNPDASTDLGVSYYYSGRTDDALKQFEYSLTLNPKHAKTLFNQGIVLAFGKRDLQGATAAWEKVVQLAPGTPEAQAAQQGLQGIAAAAGRGGAPAPAPAPSGG